MIANTISAEASMLKQDRLNVIQATELMYGPGPALLGERRSILINFLCALSNTNTHCRTKGIIYLGLYAQWVEDGSPEEEAFQAWWNVHRPKQ